MILDVKPIHDASKNCMEDILITLATYWEHDYILMFADAWGFAFHPKVSKELCTMGKRLEAGKNDCFKNIEKYHGIKAQWHYNKTMEEYTKLVGEEIDCGRPAAVFMDSYWIPWAKTFQKQHAPHYCMFIGLDENSDFVCIDPFITKEVTLLTKENFKSGNGKCITFSKDNRIGDTDWKSIVSDAANRILCKNARGYNSLDSMKSFAAEMETSLDLDFETKGYSIMFLVPLFIQLLEIGSGRFNFADVLKYLGERENIEDLVIQGEKLNKAAFGWREVRKKLMDQNNDEEQKNAIYEAASMVRALAEEEKQIAEALLCINR